MIPGRKNHYNREVSKAGMQSSNKTGLVLKISVVLFILLATVVYKLNDYFKNEKWSALQSQLRNRVVLAKTTVSSQLSQLRNTLSSYENEISDVNINWVQLDPFYVIAKLDQSAGRLQVNQILVRSNTPAERWNGPYLEKALAVNPSSEPGPILAQLFQDRSGAKFLILRFKLGGTREIAVAGNADYFQKFFDLDRGDKSTSLLATTEEILAAHSEGDYIATSTNETRLSSKKYVAEKEEIVGTNLIAMNYILKKKVATGFAVPWSIVGLVLGSGCILIAILFYSLDPIEKRVERYKKQEREQIYKDTVSGLTAKAAPMTMTPLAKAEPEPLPVPQPIQTPVKKPEPAKSQKVPNDFYTLAQEVPAAKEEPMAVMTEPDPEQTKTVSMETVFDEEVTKATQVDSAFLALDEEKIDLEDIEKALALDDFDSEEGIAKTTSAVLQKNLTSQKISTSTAGAPVTSPQFALRRKEFAVDEFKVNVRRPEKL